ncbi:MAG: hypothetical protein DMG16_05570 [Acidobacteria bacterium]|nr:MAG: hypothetical protein DMG16_05570 [Acidobacteriota bacterium]
MVRLGDLTQARLHQECAVSIDPEFADAHYQLGLTLQKQGDSAAAMALHKKYIMGAHRAPLQLRTPSCRGGL